MTWTFRGFGLVFAALGLSLPVSAQVATKGYVRPGESAYVAGTVSRIKGNLVEFPISRLDGLRKGQRLAVVRPSAGGTHVGEIDVMIVDERQAVGKSLAGTLAIGDRVVFQRLVDGGQGDILTDASPDRIIGMPVELIVKHDAAVQRDRLAYNGRIRRITYSTPFDIHAVEVDLYDGGRPPVRRTIPAVSIRHIKANGVLYVPDGRKSSLCLARVLELRDQKRRLDEIQERIEIARAKHQEEVESRERVELAKLNHEYQERMHKIGKEIEERVRQRELEESRRKHEAELPLRLEEQKKATADSQRQVSEAERQLIEARRLAPPPPPSVSYSAPAPGRSNIDKARSVVDLGEGISDLANGETWDRQVIGLAKAGVSLISLITGE